MPRFNVDKAYQNFVNGFVTEATGLTFPENTCRDIDNCDIEAKGGIRRRLGLNEEVNGEFLGPYFDSVVPDATISVYPRGGQYAVAPTGNETCTRDELAITAHYWPFPSGRTDLNFIVFQVGNYLIIRDWDADIVSSYAAIIDSVDPSSVVLRIDEHDGVLYNTNHVDASKKPLQSTVGLGRLWFTGTQTVPFYLEYDPDTQVVSLTAVGKREDVEGFLSIRDFNGVDDGLLPDEQPGTLSDEHHYNLLNQGWSDEHIDTYQDSSESDFLYPSNAQQWILGKNASDEFSPGRLVKQDFGNSLAPRGRGILHALLGDRDSVFSGVDFSDAHDEKANTGFRTNAFCFGRLWVSGEENKKRPNGVYFSKIIQKPEDAGVFMQENDPTSEHFNELLATDGGVIYITEAANISRLIPFGSGLLVMATNGIWFIYGAGVGFTATDFSVEKVSSTGIIGPSTVVATDQAVVFFANNSIHVVTLPEANIQLPTIVDVAEKRILSYYATIDKAAREKANACFDPVTKKVFWSWLEEEAYDYPHYNSFYNRILIFDTRTAAFNKYSFTVDLDEDFALGPAFARRTLTPGQSNVSVVLDDGDPVVLDSGSEVVVPSSTGSIGQDILNSIKIVMLSGSEASVRIGEFNDTSFMDYASLPGADESNYTSYIVTGDETLGDLQRNKQATYLYSFFRRTETGFTVNEDDDLIALNPSGCTVRARWDWNNTAAGGRWSDSQRAYRYRRPYSPESIDDTYDTGEEIVATKLKIRGKGRALALKYESVEGEDFQLLGWAIPYTVSGA